MQRAITAMVVFVWVLGFTVSQASAIKITTAEVQSGTAVVHGSKATAGADIVWGNGIVTQANKGGSFQFQGVVPSDCVGTLSDGVETIAVALANCAPAPPAGVLRTGQMTCWDSSGAVIACAGTGQDGDLQAGAPRSYTDNGNGTITDNVTGLMWEKITNPTGCPFSDWAGAFARIATLNATNFAGYNDWRLPNVNELQSLIDYGRQQPSIDPVFNNLPGIC